ncbi:MAG: phosphodiesterase [Corallococcus sp.]|nr:phosphodiesterase [Corallococcus sp.]MCM1359872.1 phosphodiesterase [Corallococcus sp.]MCM1395306.1 phosphodiesterase [Corallococcus sp.]
MKIFVATDLHGSVYWTQQVIEQFKLSKSDVLVLLGDIYNHGPRNPFPDDYAPMQVAEALSTVSDKLVVIKGNCDSEVDQMISPFTFLRDNVFFAFGRRLFFTHGHVYNKRSLPVLKSGDVLFYGHFHQNEIAEIDGVICVNVGSAALPKDGKHSFCLIDESGVTLSDFDGRLIASKPF